MQQCSNRSLSRHPVRHASVTGRAAAPRSRVLLRAVRSSPASKSKEALQEQLQRMEKELESLFEPGKSMPRASAVTQLRSDIAELRAQLGHGAPAQKQQSTVAQLAQRALSEVEAQLSHNSGLGADNDTEIARLEAENTKLRAEAHRLLLRQLELEEAAKKLLQGK